MTTSLPDPSATLRWLALACTPGTDRLAPPPGGWERLPALVRRHRVAGLTWRRLAAQADALPDPVAGALKRDAEALAMVNLRAAAACRALADSLGAAGLPFLFLKGLPLSRLAYGDAHVKMSRDIDLLVLPTDIGRTAAVLGSLGYRPVQPGAVAALPRWHFRSKETVWAGADGSVLELHSRLNDRPEVMAEVTALAPAQWVEVAAGLRLPTLSEPALLAYLAVHGASSAWFRLKWLADFAALLRGRDVAALFEDMRRLGAGRAGGLALLLSDKLFGCALPAELAASLHADWRLGLLVREALRQLEAPCEPTERRLGTAGIHLSQLLLADGWSGPVAEAWRRAGELAVRRIMPG
jgi:hypothetical protein